MTSLTMEHADHGIDLVTQPQLRFSIDEDAPQIFQASTTNKGVLPQESVDLIITSPPYNVGKPYNGDEAGDSVSYQEYAAFSRRWLANCYRWTRPTGRLAINISIDKNKNGKQPLSADLTRWAMDQGWKYHATILWNEGNISRRYRMGELAFSFRTAHYCPS